MKRLFQGLCRGFSLIEVTLALGIVAFGVLAIVALLPTGLSLARESSDETVAVNVLSALAADIANSSGRTNLSFLYGVSLEEVGVGSRFFDEEGRLLGASSDPSAVYKAVWSMRARDIPRGIPPQVSVQVRWPANAETPRGMVETMVDLVNHAATN